MNKDRNGNPLSKAAKENLLGNALLLIIFLVLPVLAAFVIDWAMEKTPLYDNLYDNQVQVLYHNGEERSYDGSPWKSGYEENPAEDPEKYDDEYITYHIHNGRKIYGQHAYGFEIIDGHAEAHHPQRVYDQSVGDYVNKPDTMYPGKEIAAMKWYAAFVFALLILTPLGPQHFLPRRRRILAEAEKDFLDNQTLQGGRLGLQDIFVAEQGIAEAPIEGEWILTKSLLGANLDNYNGESVPNLDQISAMLWFTNGERTIRVKVLNDRHIRNTVAGAVEKWLNVISPMTHVGATLEAFRNTRDGRRPTTVLNEILTDSVKPLNERRPVKLYGGFQAEDLLLATGLGIGAAEGSEVQQIVLPTGFLAGVISDVKKVTGEDLPKPWYVGGTGQDQLAA